MADKAMVVKTRVENAFWRRNFKSRPYVREDSTYTAYRPAYQFGWESHRDTAGRTWLTVEAELREGWEKKNGQSTLPWSEAGSAVRDAWERIASRQVVLVAARDTPFR